MKALTLSIVLCFTLGSVACAGLGSNIRSFGSAVSSHVDRAVHTAGSVAADAVDSGVSFTVGSIFNAIADLFDFGASVTDRVKTAVEPSDPEA